MAFLFKFLFRNLKGYRWLVALAILVSIAEVVCNLGVAFPIKFITSKVGSLGNDPSCEFPFLGTHYQSGILGLFDLARCPYPDPGRAHREHCKMRRTGLSPAFGSGT
jgi:hypothetical protein